jgi:LPS sulfotransferase NodH
MALIVTLVTPINSVLGWFQSWLYGRKIEETKIERPPVFIVGHWRSGTTLLHELMFLDNQFGSPTTYQCCTPHHFLVSERFLPWCTSFLLPKNRPMDNMAAGWERPQEDEFALLAMGSPTPYFRMAYPDDPPPFMEFLDMEGTKPADLKRFESTLVRFVKMLTLHSGKQVLLKSPPHTGRIEVLAKLFPGAKFVHIARHPDAIYPSTLKLWFILDDAQGFGIAREGEHRQEYVFQAFERMYHGFDKQRAAFDERHLCEIRYEDLVADPVATVERIYRQLELDNFESLRPKIAEYAAAQKDYKTNVHELDEPLKAEIRRRWAGYLRRYGYE